MDVERNESRNPVPRIVGCDHCLLELARASDPRAWPPRTACFPEPLPLPDRRTPCRKQRHAVVPQSRRSSGSRRHTLRAAGAGVHLCRRTTLGGVQKAPNRLDKVACGLPAKVTRISSNIWFPLCLLAWLAPAEQCCKPITSWRKDASWVTCATSTSQSRARRSRSGYSSTVSGPALFRQPDGPGTTKSSQT